MGLLDKFSEVKVDNSRRLSAEDMEECKLEETEFNKAYNAYLTAYNVVSAAYNKQSHSRIYIWEYMDCGVRELEETITSLKLRFINRITSYFGGKYQIDFSYYSKSNRGGLEFSNTENITLDEVLDKCIFSRLDGLNFAEYALNQAMEKNIIKRQEWNKWRETWNYEVKAKNIKLRYGFSGIKPLLYFYDSNGETLSGELRHNKVDCITEYKNGNTAIKFLSAEYALTFAKKYLGYIEMTDEEKKKIENGQG